MACTSMSISTPKDIAIRRSDSGSDLRCELSSTGMRRSRSEPQLRCSLSLPRAAAPPTKLKTSRSIGLFPFTSKSILNNDHDHPSEQNNGSAGMTSLEDPTEAECEVGKDKRANWVERLLELRTRWRDRQYKDDEEEEENESYCGISYDSDDEFVEEEEEISEWDRDKFSKFLSRVPWSETKLFSKLAFLCNMAYVIPELKAEDLRKYYDLWLVSSSLVKKSEAAIKAKLESDPTITGPPITKHVVNGSGSVPLQNKRPNRSSKAYDIAASAASYVHSRAKGLMSLVGSDESGSTNEEVTRGERVSKSEMAAFMAASTMTAVVAAEEEARLEAAKDLSSLHSSPCEWFVCDDHNTCTRCFVIQGSDSLASWQANLFFEPTKFEDTEVLVHRGIYEAAKGIYDQFMPEILAHLRDYGDQARLRFTGHSLGGSLSLLVNLMLLTRGVVPRSALLPVVTFGSPSVFCGGHRILDELGLDESHICSVMMHRDIVPRAFSCSYPNHVAQVLKRLNGAFRSHPCLNNEKLLYSALGKLFILQPDEKFSPPHPLMPSGAALYSLDRNGRNNGASKSSSNSALRAFLNSPHPLETLSDPAAYGSEGSILRDHDSSNYLKAINGLLRQHTKSFVRKSRKQRFNHWWPLLTTSSRELVFENPGLVSKEVVSGTV